MAENRRGWRAWQIDLLCGTNEPGKTLDIVTMGRTGQAMALRAAGLAYCPGAPPAPLPGSDLLRRVYLVDALACRHCGATRRLLAFVTDPSAILRILEHFAKTGRGPPDEHGQARAQTRVVIAEQDPIP